MITAQGDDPVGFTATSLNSVAAEPPLISFGVGTSSSSWPVIARAEHIGVHILGEHQQELAATFARSGADRFGAAHRLEHAVPRAFRSSTAYWPGWCAGSSTGSRPATTASCIAEAVVGDPAGAGRPLLYHQGRFNALRD